MRSSPFKKIVMANKLGLWRSSQKTSKIYSSILMVSTRSPLPPVDGSKSIVKTQRINENLR
jgi:hypothetical protein